MWRAPPGGRTGLAGSGRCLAVIVEDIARGVLRLAPLVLSLPLDLLRLALGLVD